MKKKHVMPFFLTHAKKYLDSIPDVDRGAIGRDIGAIVAGELAFVTTKQLKGPVRELRVGHHRVTYFTIGTNIYFVRGFRKKSAKTPKNEILYAEKIYKQLKSN